MFNKVVIVGVGLLGGSLARDLRAHGLAKQLVGVSRSQATATSALELGVVDAVEPLSQAVQGADLVVLATPMQAMLPTLIELAPSLATETIITDVGSVKTDLYQQLKSKLPALLAKFVLAHPIAGGENSGVRASRADLFVGKHVILTATDEVDQAAHLNVDAMWRAIGADTVSMSLQQHDAIFARTSHLPHVVAFSLVNYLSAQPNREQLFELAAAGFYDFTRIASSNAEMWRDICITNQSEVISALDGYIGQLEQIRDNISQLDQATILEYFGAAKRARDTGLLNKQAENKR